MGVTLNIWGEICKTIDTSTPTWWKEQINSHNNITNRKGALSNGLLHYRFCPPDLVQMS